MLQNDVMLTHYNKHLITHNFNAVAFFQTSKIIAPRLFVQPFEKFMSLLAGRKAPGYLSRLTSHLKCACHS